MAAPIRSGFLLPASSEWLLYSKLIRECDECTIYSTCHELKNTIVKIGREFVTGSAKTAHFTHPIIFFVLP